jgi:hypothetical protein
MPGERRKASRRRGWTIIGRFTAGALKDIAKSRREDTAIVCVRPGRRPIAWYWIRIYDRQQFKNAIYLTRCTQGLGDPVADTYRRDIALREPMLSGASRDLLFEATCSIISGHARKLGFNVRLAVRPCD